MGPFSCFHRKTFFFSQLGAKFNLSFLCWPPPFSLPFLRCLAERLFFSLLARALEPVFPRRLSPRQCKFPLLHFPYEEAPPFSTLIRYPPPPRAGPPLNHVLGMAAQASFLFLFSIPSIEPGVCPPRHFLASSRTQLAVFFLLLLGGQTKNTPPPKTKKRGHLSVYPFSLPQAQSH